MTTRDQEEQDWKIEQMIEDIVQKRVNALKLLAEADKLRRDRMLAPWQIVIAAMAAGGALVAGTATATGLLLHALGKL